MYRATCSGLLAVMGLLIASSAAAQTRLNQVDPLIVERSLPKASDQIGGSDAPIVAPPVTTRSDARKGAPRIASSIVVNGSSDVARTIFTDVIVSYLGRDLSDSDLAQLAGAVASATRKAGFPFASAMIEPQGLSDGILRVTLDAGELSAVRVIGAINPYADRILTQALVTGHSVRRGDLERAILLVGDVPGVTVKESRYIRQDGFGILLVTIAQKRASAYAQLDNRGSKEVGPLRSTLLGNIRDVLQPGDELGLIAAQTPFHPTEFFFVRGRYTAPIDSKGAIVSVSASYGRTNPGASLQPLHVIGESVDAAVSYSMPLFRSRMRSLWGSVEFRGLSSDQTLLGNPLRSDRLATFTAALLGKAKTGPSTVRGEIMIIGGLPLPGVTRESDVHKSRSDGDARFVTLGFDVQWTAPLAKRVSIVLASQGQLASRPLLATSQISVGGAAFGRGYDYAERTGDNGILGSGELHYDVSGFALRVIDRLQFYGSVDGGYVSNLRGGAGGGPLLSTGAGVRLGRGRFDAALELALPLNNDRFDTGNRQPRISFRISRVF